MPSKHLGSTFLALLLVGIVGILTPIAQASPPDPTWIRGMYDGGDFDDVIALITFGSGLVAEIVRVEIRPELSIVTAVLTPDDDSVPSHSVASAQPRAPPAA